MQKALTELDRIHRDLMELVRTTREPKVRKGIRAALVRVRRAYQLAAK